MIRTALLAASLALVGAPAFAPPAFASDARLVSRLYNPDEVVRIEGRTGVQATISLGEDEHIENVAIGDSTSWQVTPNKRANLLFVKPLTARARTNMTVVTDRHTYFFDLVASAEARPLYVLRFTYPEAPKAEALPQQAGTEGLTPEEAQAVGGAPVERPVDPAALNFAWRTRGDGKLLPSRVYDDGQATYLSWAAGVALPAIQIRDEKGAEGPVNYAVRGDVIVIDGVPPLIVLRSGRDSATLENRGTPRRPVEAETSTPAVAAATQPQGQPQGQ